jgi:hypothetical protein
VGFPKSGDWLELELKLPRTARIAITMMAVPNQALQFVPWRRRV